MGSRCARLVGTFDAVTAFNSVQYAADPVAALREVPTPLIYPDLATAVRTQLSSGPARMAIEHAGEQATRDALTAAFADSRQRDGSYRQDNSFRYLIAWA